MERQARDFGSFVGFGAVSIHLERAALCCEETCEAIFQIIPSRGARTVVCPGCGGSSWLPLSTIVPSLRIAVPSLRIAPAGTMGVVPAERVRA